MNIIDDFLSYVWTIALKTKVDASKAFQIWCNTVENQSNKRLKILITDNRELLSNNMLKWCGDHGIKHLLTAPYTSTQNGCAEHLHLHCTITKSAKSR
jgi:transposase InsO family protein